MLLGPADARNADPGKLRKIPCRFPMFREFDVETGSMATASATTRSLELGNFLSCAKRPRTGGLWRRHCGLCRGQFRRGRDFGRVVSGLEIRLLGNGDRCRQGRVRMSDDFVLKPSIRCWRDHSAGISLSRTTPIPCGSRPPMAALTRSGARKASEIVMLTMRTLHPSRSAMLSVLAAGSLMSSSSHRRPRAIDATRSARFSERIGRMF